jgi:phosphoribosylamine--glycine ligase
MEDLTVMIVDGSARAHALSSAYEASPNVKRIIVSPGNAGIGYKRQKDVFIEPGKLTDPNTFLAVAQKYKPDLIDVCQDDALAVGTVDLLHQHGFRAFGPTRAAARLEWDKAWSRQFMTEHNVPSPDFRTFTSEKEGIAFVEGHFGMGGKPLYIKAAGLCAGKGAIPATNAEEAVQAIQTMKSFGDAGKTYLIEKTLVGEEASVYAISSGNAFAMVKAAQDHKRRDNRDLGPNTGGMGSVAPCGLVNALVAERVEKTIIRPTLEGMARAGAPYVGILYGGIMVDDHHPYVVEFNSRWGAPEAEVVIPSIKTPMDKIVLGALEGTLPVISMDTKTRVCIVGASKGYPGDVSAVKGKQVHGLEDAMKMPGIQIFSAGLNVVDGKFYANGGRLFSVVAEADTCADAQLLALEAMMRIKIDGDNLYFRTDIGHRDIARELQSAP